MPPPSLEERFGVREEKQDLKHHDRHLSVLGEETNNVAGTLSRVAVYFDIPYHPWKGDENAQADRKKGVSYRISTQELAMPGWTINGQRDCL